MQTTNLTSDHQSSANDASGVAARDTDSATHTEGRHTFHFTYDDTGETVPVTAPNGWTMQRVIDEAYGELGESAQPDDRVEFAGPQGVQLITPDLRALKVKEFAGRDIAPDGKFHIVSKPGGAVYRQVARSEAVR